MALRPVFIPVFEEEGLVTVRTVHFQWFPGLSLAQKRKSIAALHEAAQQLPGISRVLEISSKSPEPLGVALSAFNLSITTPRGRRYTVEAAYQSSKVFEQGGPYLDLLDQPARAAKTDPRLRESGALLGFRFYGVDWPLEPPAAFYDWVYLNALDQHPELATAVSTYSAFSDIEFNPKTAYSCQAGSAALYAALARRGQLRQALGSPKTFLAFRKVVSAGS